jgi:hypothetical protein
MEYPWKKKIRNKWNSRSKIITDLLFSNIKVLDIGGGLGNIKKFLNGCNYTSVDLQKWTNNTVVADMDKETPDLGKFDIIICQGILEYINNIENFIIKIHKYGEKLILTYRLKNDKCPVERNNINFDILRKLLEDKKWKIISESDGMVKSERVFYCINNDR